MNTFETIEQAEAIQQQENYDVDPVEAIYIAAIEDYKYEYDDKD